MKFKQLSFFLLITMFAQGVFAAAADVKGTESESSSPVEVIFETSMGSFTLELFPEKAPKTVANFLAYVDEGFYTNSIFHRVIKGFAVQTGGYEKGRKPKETTRVPVKNESANLLKNISGSVSMARRMHADSATSQFFINLAHNVNLDYKNKYQPGYTVFGQVSKGMDVIQKIAEVPTTTIDPFRDIPKEDIVILSAKRKAPKTAKKAEVKKQAEVEADTEVRKQEGFVAGEHYEVLERPVPTRDKSKIEVVEMFSYGCPHCYEFESLVKDWSNQKTGDVDFWVFPAVWNKPMALYARAFYTAEKLDVAKIIHHPLFTAIVIEQQNIRNESDLADFFARYGVNKEAFIEAFNSADVRAKVEHAQERVRLYKPVGVPEIIVNGKYRIDRMRAGGLAEMLAVVDFLISKERATLKE